MPPATRSGACVIKYKLLVQNEPGGQPVPNLGVRVRRKSDGVTLTTLTTDADGFVTYQASGHPVPFFFETTNTIGGHRYWASDDVLPAGALSLAEAPIALRALGDGVITGLLSGLSASLSGTTVTLGTGGALCAGYPVLNYSAVSLPLTRPASGTRVDRIVARAYPAGASTSPGYADVALVSGDGVSTPALVQTANEHQVALWLLSVPSVGAITLTDERTAVLSGYLTRPTTIAGTAIAQSASTSSAGGEALSGLTVSLVLPTSRTYDISATLSAIQNVSDPVAPSAELVFSHSFGGFGASDGLFSAPRQTAVDGSGNIHVADAGNNRVQTFTAAGVFSSKISLGLRPYGVAVDGSGNRYVAVQRSEGYQYQCGTSSGVPYFCTTCCHYFVALRKYNSAGVQQWSVDLGSYSSSSSNTPRQVATDGTHVYALRSDSKTIWKRLCSTGGAVSTWGGSGSGNGQFQSVDGIATDGDAVWVSDRILNRVQRFTSAGVYVSQFGVSGSGAGQLNAPQGLAYDSANALLAVADSGNHRIQRFAAATGVVVDTAGTLGSGDGNLNAPLGVAVNSAGDLIVADTGNHRVVIFTSESGGGSPPGGHRTVAVEIDGNLCPYLGPGQITTAIGNAHVLSKAGPATVLVKAFGKATADTLGLRAAVLSATAIPRG